MVGRARDSRRSARRCWVSSVVDCSVVRRHVPLALGRVGCQRGGLVVRVLAEAAGESWWRRLLATQVGEAEQFAVGGPVVGQGLAVDVGDEVVQRVGGADRVGGAFKALQFFHAPVESKCCEQVALQECWQCGGGEVAVGGAAV